MNLYINSMVFHGLPIPNSAASAAREHTFTRWYDRRRQTLSRQGKNGSAEYGSNSPQSRGVQHTALELSLLVLLFVEAESLRAIIAEKPV